MQQAPDANAKLPIASFPGYVLRRAASGAMTELTAILAQFDLRIAEASILVLVHANPGCQQSEIGRLLDIVSANLTPRLHRLEKCGLLKRTPLDGRTNAVELTAEGAELAEKVLVEMNAFERRILDIVRPLDENEFMTALHKLVAAFSS